ncbi:MAG TPA: fused MFS/spermidine synthase [Thermomicrobiales bacterium]|nr:fused MFS/spermidine synthase [Thermomicrobiales bacterium]
MVSASHSISHRRPAWLDPRAAVLSTIVFVGGICSIAVETSASRLVGPYFGSSTFIWANLIGLTLLYLTIGYFLGGKIADRYPEPAVLYTLTAVAGFSVAFIPMLSRPILEISLAAFDNVSVGAFYGSLLGTMLLFAVPVTLLGCVSPFAVRLRLDDVAAAGNTAGSLYALSTVGSIIGSFLPTFLLIPVFGTRTTFLILALAMLIPSLLALAAVRAVREVALSVAMLLVVALVPVIQPAGLIRPPEYGRVIYEAETRYNYVQVIQYQDETRLALNEGHATHSIYSPNRELTGGPWDYFMVGSYFNANATPDDVNSLLLVGLAAGTVAQQFTAAYGPIPIDGVEIDGEIVEIGRKFFNMNEPNLNVVVDDGRYYLSRSEKKYDVIGVDAYRQPYIPFHLTTREFFQSASDHLNDDGVVVLNAGRTTTDFRLVDVMASTMASVFPNVYIIDVARFTNSMVIATKQPTDIASFAANIANIPEGSLIRQVGDIAIETGNIREWTGHDRVFTDDLAPVELVVDQIILRAATEER